VRHDLPVASQDLLEAMARGVVVVEAEHVVVVGGCCSKMREKVEAMNELCSRPREAVRN
jgi:methionine synthase I (cobalamin-dependent)